MNKSAPHYTNEQTGVSYTLSTGGYYLPDIKPTDEPQYDIGRFGRMRSNYLKNHRKVLYINLLTSGELNHHLHEIDQTANDRMELITGQMAEAEGVTERLKAENQILWVKKMISIRSRVEEMICEELIYC